VVFITFDEDDGDTNSNHVYTVVVGPPTIVKHGYKSETRYDHYSLLATIEEIFSLGNLGRDDVKAGVISDVFYEHVESPSPPGQSTPGQNNTGKDAPASKELKEYNIKTGNNETRKMHYQMNGGELSRLEIKANSSRITAMITPSSNGTLTVELPRSIIQSQSNGKDIAYQILIDGKVARFDERESLADARIVSIDFNATSTEIDIIGTSVIPEFSFISGGSMSALAFAVGIFPMIVRHWFTRKFYQVS
jgi:hypothetical protein